MNLGGRIWGRGTPAPAVPAPRIRADFEGGNVEAAELIAPGHARFRARAGSSPRPLWFYFCIEDAHVPAVRCDLTNADQCLGPRYGWRTVRPVFSSDGRVWQRVARTEYVEQTESAGYFSFTVPIIGPSTYVAYCYPYTTVDLRDLLRSLPERPDVKQAELCRSSEGLSVPYLRLGAEDAPAHNIWVVARQHAGETPGSFVAEGMVRHLAGLPEEALADVAVHVVPMVDTDGVCHGLYGKDQAPIDYNRDWRDAPARPETAALLRALRQAHARQPVSLVVDLHASHHGDTACYAFARPSDGRSVTTELLGLLEAEGGHVFGFRATDVRQEPAPPGSARDYLERGVGVPVVTLEMSYHLAQNGEYLTPRHYREFGAALARALLRRSAP